MDFFILTFPGLFTIGPRSDCTPIAVNTHNTKFFFLMYHSPLRGTRNKDSLKKWFILGLGLKMYNVSLEYLAMPESKKVHKINVIVSKGFRL